MHFEDPTLNPTAMDIEVMKTVMNLVLMFYCLNDLFFLLSLSTIKATHYEIDTHCSFTRFSTKPKKSFFSQDVLHLRNKKLIPVT